MAIKYYGFDILSTWRYMEEEPTLDDASFNWSETVWLMYSQPS